LGDFYWGGVIIDLKDWDEKRNKKVKKTLWGELSWGRGIFVGNKGENGVILARNFRGKIGVV
jgi:hypothetical protein